MTRSPAKSIEDGGVYAPDGPYSFARLALSLLISTLVGAGMWAIIVVMPEAQRDFGVDRSAASLPYTLMMCTLAFCDDRARADDRSPRHRLASGHFWLELGARLRSRRIRAEPSRVLGRPCADRSRRGDRLRADDGGYFALVRQAARGCGGRRRVRQLPRRHDLAARDEPFDAAHRLAGSLRRHRPHHRRDCLAAGVGDAPPAIRGGVRRSRGGDRGGARRCRHISAATAYSPCARRLFLLRRDVDAASPPRRLLRRPRLWRRPRRGNAVADDGARHHLANWLRIRRRRDRRVRRR